MSELIENILNSNSISLLYPAVYRLAQQSPTFFQANEAQFTQKLPTITSKILQTLRYNQEQINQRQLISPLIQNILTKLPNKTRQQNITNLRQIQNTQSSLLRNNILQQRQQQLEQKNQNLLLQKYQNQQLKQSPIQSFNTISSQINPNASTIQASISQYGSILNNRVQNLRQTQPNQIPKSVRMLQQYAKIKNTIPIGSITNYGGVSYLGVVQNKINGQTIYSPFPKNKITYTTMPNIGNQLQYHANKTINSWNNFVKDQYQLLNFVKKVNDPIKRKQYIAKQFTNLNTSTFAAQVLATLTYYYVFIPLQNYFKKLRFETRPISSILDFLTKYQTGAQSDSNPIMLNSSQARSLAAILLNWDQAKKQKLQAPTPIVLYIKISKGLKTLKNAMNTLQIDKISNWVQQKVAQANSYFAQSGLHATQYASLLSNLQIKSIKKRKMIKLLGIANNQIAQIVQTVVRKNQTGIQSTTKLWTNNWQSTQIYCHDYIFRQK